MYARVNEMDTKTMVTTKSELTFSERLSQRLKMQVSFFTFHSSDTVVSRVTSDLQLLTKCQQKLPLFYLSQ